MTEAQWLAWADPTPMLVLLQGKASERKLRLFSVACCRGVWDLLVEMERADIGYGRLAVRLAEDVADGRATVGDVARAVIDQVGMIDSGFSPEGQLLGGALPALADIDPAGGAARVSRFAGMARHRRARNQGMAARGERDRPSEASLAEGRAAFEAAIACQSDLLRDIFGNPFRSVVLDLSWLTSTVHAVAGRIYETRDFTAMPILGDALQDAGCEDADILSHCRGSGPHVRGCWLVDLVLGKE